MDTVTLGKSHVTVPPLGVGTWAWGDRRFWQYDEGAYGPRDVVDAFTASVEAGLTFFDTAEVYGHGESEKILGWLVRKYGEKLVVASKFAPLPGRDARTVTKALQATLKRMGLAKIDLYQIHWCDTSVSSIDAMMGALADVVQQGLVESVGVSNYTANEMREAHASLSKRGVPLAVNQVEYSLLNRAPERDGVLDACRELGVTLLAYSPLAQGLLAGSYPPGTPAPPGPRGEKEMFSEDNRARAQRVVEVLREVGAVHGGALPEQVALRWLMDQPGVVPLAGAKTGIQARNNAGAMRFSLSETEMARIGEAAKEW